MTKIKLLVVCCNFIIWQFTILYASCFCKAKKWVCYPTGTSCNSGLPDRTIILTIVCSKQKQFELRFVDPINCISCDYQSIMKPRISVLEEQIKAYSRSLMLFNDKSLIVKSLWVHAHWKSENKGHVKGNLHRWVLKCPEDFPVTQNAVQIWKLIKPLHN